MSIEIVNSRIIESPIAEVFEAFENPEILARWWGPNGFTNRVTKFEFKPGGEWGIVMIAPDGTEYDNHSKFITVEKPHCIEYEHLGPMHRFLMKISYTELSATTTGLKWEMTLDRTEQHEKLQSFLADANEQNIDRLCAVLKERST